MSNTAIIGFGCAGYHAAKALREACPQESIHVYTDTENAPANPMLTTYYIAGKIPRERQFPHGTLRDIADDLRLELTGAVRKVSAGKMTVTSADGTEAAYDDIVIATGSHPLVPPIPGLPETGIYVMRTVADADRLMAAVEKGISSALVIGASWVGIKVVEALYTHGVPVTMADMAPHIFPTAALPETAELIHSRMNDMGIGLKFGCGISSFRTEGKQIISEFSDGSEVRSDAVALCLGLRPTLDMIDRNEFEMGKGLRVDCHMQTSVPHIYAVGDCCETRELVTGQPMGVLTWANAGLQGTVAGENIAGKDAVFQGNLLHNITHFFDMDFIGLGDNRRAGARIHYVHPRAGWTYDAIIADGRPVCINIFENRRLSGPARLALIRQMAEQDAVLNAAERFALKQAGLPENLITWKSGVAL